MVIDLADRGDLSGGTADEDLIGDVQLGSSDVTLDQLVAQVAGDLYD